MSDSPASTAVRHTLSLPTWTQHPHSSVRDYGHFTTSPLEDNSSHPASPFTLESRLMGRAPSLSEDDSSSVSSSHELSPHFDGPGHHHAHPLAPGEEARLARDVAHLFSAGSRRASNSSDALSSHSNDSALESSWGQLKSSSVSSDASSQSASGHSPDSSAPVNIPQWPGPAYYEQPKASQGIPMPLQDGSDGQIDLDPTPNALSWMQHYPIGTDPLHAAHVYAPPPGHIQFLEDAIPNHDFIDPHMFPSLPPVASVVSAAQQQHQQQRQYQDYHQPPHAAHHHAPPQQAHYPPSLVPRPPQPQESTDYDYALHYQPPAGPGLADWAATLNEHDVARRSSFPPVVVKQEPQNLSVAHHIVTTATGRQGRRASMPVFKEPLHWASQTTAATKQAAIARRKPGIEARFACHYCGESFTRAYNLRGHLRAHQGERPFVCDFPGCGKAFARSHDKRRHQDLHSTACKYRCELCNRPFRRLDALNRHHKQEAEQPCSTASGRCFAHSEGHCSSAVGSAQQPQEIE